MPGLNEETEKSRVKSKELSLTQHWLAAAWRNTGDSPYDAAAVARRADSKARGTPAIRMVVAGSNSPPPASLSCSYQHSRVDTATSRICIDEKRVGAKTRRIKGVCS